MKGAAYRTLLRFDPPVPVTLELEAPGGMPERRAVAVAGLGRAGRAHFVEDAGGARLPLAAVRRAWAARGHEVDLRQVILDREERAAFRAGQRLRVAPRWSAARRLRDAGRGAALFAVLWGAGFGLSRITGRAEDLLHVLVWGAVAGLGLMLAMPPVWRGWGEVRLLLGLWRR